MARHSQLSSHLSWHLRAQNSPAQQGSNEQGMADKNARMTQIRMQKWAVPVTEKHRSRRSRLCCGEIDSHSSSSLVRIAVAWDSLRGPRSSRLSFFGNFQSGCSATAERKSVSESAARRSISVSASDILGLAAPEVSWSPHKTTKQMQREIERNRRKKTASYRRLRSID